MATTDSLGVSNQLPAACERRSRLRVAIVATPRSGNTWLKGLLGSLYGLPDIICDRPDEVPWNTLPERCVIQLHWSPEPELLELFERHAIRPVTIVRHPLDTLISILHFCTTWPGTSRWFGGRGGNEDMIRGCLPTSPAFLDYATGPRARALMAISLEWWSCASCHNLCYERLAEDPLTELSRLGNFLEPVSPQVIQSAIDGNSLEKTRPKVANQHHWVGTSAHWKRLIPASVAGQIASAHAMHVELLRYDCTADGCPTATQADLNWFALEIQSLRQELSRTRSQLLDAQLRLESTESYLALARSIAKPLRPLRELGRQSVQMAQRLHAQAIRPFARKAG